MKYYVNAKATIGGDGSEAYPFRRIQQAANIAGPGDEVLVLPGIYREYVNPIRAGREDARITYRAYDRSEEGRRATVITGAEELKGWMPFEDYENVWTARVPNTLFGDYNPYTTLVRGDWFIETFVAHTGDVYLNHKSMYEVQSLDGVLNPQKSNASWDKEFSLYTWYCQQDAEKNETVFYANFQGKDPNAEEVEISARQDCFLPKAEGISYITLSGFTVREAATQWAPPTAYQDGMIGPHWSKGWIIEDCEVYESKCSGISLGKYLQPDNDNKWLKWKYKDGTQTERDCICQASYEGWDKEHIGSHQIRRCIIHDCGQTGIVGHLGGVFSVIENNHIYNINNKQNLAGAEIGGIKMHAAIDVIFRHNHIHHCTRGIWLDWQAQGTRVTQNLMYDNTLPIDLDAVDTSNMMAVYSALGEDIFVEVSHGPTLIDNNILLSSRSVKMATQGIALVHNLITGSLCCVGTGTDNGGAGKASPRYTPYHEIHGTKVMGFMTFLHGDDRFYNNIFVQQKIHPLLQAMQDGYRANPASAGGWDDSNFEAGTFPFDEYPTFAEWDAKFEGYCGMGSPDSDRYYAHLPVWSAGNVYLNGAKAWKKEEDPVVSSAEVFVRVPPENAGSGATDPASMSSSAGLKWPSIETNLFEALAKAGGDRACRLIATDTLGMAFEPEEKYENPDGSPILFDEDIYGNKRSGRIAAGPFA